MYSTICPSVRVMGLSPTETLPAGNVHKLLTSIGQLLRHLLQGGKRFILYFFPLHRDEQMAKLNSHRCNDLFHGPVLYCRTKVVPEGRVHLHMSWWEDSPLFTQMRSPVLLCLEKPRWSISQRSPPSVCNSSGLGNLPASVSRLYPDVIGGIRNKQQHNLCMALWQGCCCVSEMRPG